MDDTNKPKARIVNGNDFGGIHPQKWLNANQNKVIGGQLVSNWTLTPILPNPLYKQPNWGGSKWIEAFIEVVKIPLQVHNYRFRLALIYFGVLPSSVDAAIDAIEDAVQKEKLFSLWNFAPFLERADPSLINMANDFGITPAALDQIFIYANSK